MPDAPIDLAAEMACLGSVLQRPALAAEVFAVAVPTEFYGRNLELACLLADMAERGQPIDPQLVWAEAQRRGLGMKIDPPYLVTLVERAWNPDGAVMHARDVHRAALRWRLRELGTRLVQQADSVEVDVAAAAFEVMAGAEDVLGRAAPTRREKSPTVADVTAGESVFDWLVPGLLERGDRMLFSGYEGLGKSTWCRQVAVCVAAGLNPFTAERITPRQVLYVDCENGRHLLQRAYRPLMAVAAAHVPEWDPSRLRIEIQRDGIDLGNPTDAGWLLERVTTNAPELLVIGPLYRLHSAEVGKEEAARELVGVLDRCRAVSNCALLVEAHSPHGEAGGRATRPAGSSLFMRWPEFGYGLVPSKRGQHPVTRVAMRPWRGDRDVRSWPSHLRRGEPHQMPWVVDVAAMEDEVRR